MNTKQQLPNTIIQQHDWLQSISPYQNKAVRPDPSMGSGQGNTLRESKGEHLIFFGMETVEEVEMLQTALWESA